MSLDRRLRESLPEVVSAVDPDLGTSYHHVVGRSRRRARNRRIAQATAALLGCVVIAGSAIAIGFDDAQEVSTDPAPIADADSRPALLAGAIDVVIDAGPDELVPGTWAAELRGDGTVALVAPPAFTGTRSGLFRATANAFETDLFSSDLCSGLDPGRYGWERSGGTITFVLVDDPCAPRARLFASRPWSESDGG